MKLIIIPSNVVQILFILLIVNNGNAIQNVVDVVEPVSVENGTDKVVLDCPYEIDGEDAKNLVIKWYYNNSLSYQWIPSGGLSPQALGILKGRLDINHNVTEDRFTKYRALAIINPTTDLSGSYRCTFSSVEQEKSVVVNLTVYSTSPDIFIDFREVDDLVHIICSASGFFPEPDLHLFKGFEEESKAETKSSEIDSSFEDADGTFNTTLTRVYTRNELSYENQFTCELTLPQTDVVVKDSLLYYPEGTSSTTSTLPPITTPSTLLFKSNDNKDDEPQSSGEESKVNSNIIFTCVAFLNIIMFFLLETR